LQWVPPADDSSFASFVKDSSGPFSLGWLGVEFFFMISGFVIFLTLQKSTSILDFAVRRFARLWPALVVCCAITYLITPHLGGQIATPPRAAVLPSLLLVSDYLNLPWVDGAYWSLAVEVTFYVWVSLTFFGARRFFVPVWCAFTIVSSLLPALFTQSGFSFLCAPYAPFFAFGIASYLRYSEQRWTWKSIALLIAAVVSYALSWHDRNIGVHLASLAMVGLFVAFLNGRLEWIAAPAVIAIGQASYSLYLLHDLLGTAALSSIYLRTNIPHGLAITAMGALAVTLSLVIYRTVETPSRRAIMSWWGRRVPRA
jgi:peptidoglycan/LPS O-acetylase OafA/YrhL